MIDMAFDDSKFCVIVSKFGNGVNHEIHYR